MLCSGSFTATARGVRVGDAAARAIVLVVMLFAAPIVHAGFDIDYSPAGFHYAVLNAGDLLGGVLGNYPAGINNFGDVIAYGRQPFDVVTGPSYSFIWSRGELTNISARLNTAFYATGVNDLGQVVGYTGGDSAGVHGLSWQAGQPTFGFTDPQTPIGINNAGTIIFAPDTTNSEPITWLATNTVGGFVGYNSQPRNFPLLNGARLRQGGNITQLPFYQATGINKSGQIVGAHATLDSNSILNTTPILYSDSTIYQLRTLSGLQTLDSAAGINDFGQIVARNSDGSSSGHNILRLTPFKPYAQVAQPWSELPINWRLPPGQQQTIGIAGCTLTAITTIATYYGAHVDPVQVRDALIGNTIDRYNNTNLRLGQHLNLGGVSFDVAARTHGYDQIVSELRQGEPVMLKVPDSKTGRPSDDGTTGHYVVAYQFAPNLHFDASNPDPKDIFISNPGSSVKTLTTLSDYFADLNQSNLFYRFSAKSWFDTGSDDGGTYQNQSLDKLVTSFRRDLPGITLPRPHAPPVLVVHSPVELLISDGLNRFATSSNIAFTGETILAHQRFEDVTADGFNPPPDTSPFAPYFVELPPDMNGESLDLQIIGVGNGSYEISYLSGDPHFFSNDLLTGEAFEFSRDDGHISVVEADVPEPSLLGLCLLPLALLQRRQIRGPRTKT